MKDNIGRRMLPHTEEEIEALKLDENQTKVYFKKHLKAYLNGEKYFTYGTKAGRPIWRTVKQEYFNKETLEVIPFNEVNNVNKK